MARTLNGKYLLLLSIVLLCGATAPARAQGAGDLAALRRVRLVAVGDWRGDAGFKRRLMRDMKAMGFRWVERSRAQGVVSARTSWSKGGFTGEMWIRDRMGRLLWHQSAYRSPHSNTMAGQTLAARLRAAMGR